MIFAKKEEPKTFTHSPKADEDLDKPKRDFFFRWFDSYTLEERRGKSKELQSKYIERIPILVAPLNDKVPKISSHKYLVPNHLTVGHFQHIVRSRIKLAPEEALFMFLVCVDEKGKVQKETLLSSNKLLQQVVQEDNTSQDGFLYFRYSLENTFG